jgi:hypothetical protein
MKIRWVSFALLIAATAINLPAQSREDVRIYLPLVVAVDPMQADFFRKNFAMEIAAAGYTVTENVTEADYSLRVRVSENTASPSDDQYALQLSLLRNSDNSQVVSLSFGFTELEEMYNHNLSLIYQVLANVPLSSGDDKTLVKYMVGQNADREDWWRNKWLYLRASFDFPISYYQSQPDGLYEGVFTYDGPMENPARYSRNTHRIIPMPGATIGLEVQFLYWMSFEANFEMRIGDAVGFALMPGIGAQVKFPIKPSTHFMLEPYITAVLSANNEDDSISFSRYSIGGGAQLGVRGGRMGAFFFDASYLYSLNEAVTNNPDPVFPHPAKLHWKRSVIGLSLGYKVGFINRDGGQREENSTWLFK